MDAEFLTAWEKASQGIHALAPITVAEFRQAANNAQEWAAQSLPSWSKGSAKELRIVMRDGYINVCRVWCPGNVTSDTPLVLWYHGGGYCLGDAAYEEEICRRLCESLNCVVVSVNYRLAPEYLFPTAINDCWDALKWVAAHSQDLGSNPKCGFILAGSSAGANICAVLCHMVKDCAIEESITGIYLGLPIVVHPMAVPEIYRDRYKSYEENKDMPCLSRSSLEMLINAYKPDPQSPLYSALLWPTGHKGLQPTYFQICDYDVVRDDGVIYEKALRDSGVTTKVDNYPVPHAFQGVDPELPIVKKFNQDMIGGIRWLLNGGSTTGPNCQENGS